MKTQIVKTIKDLISIPSQGGIDETDLILQYLLNKCGGKILKHNDKGVGLALEFIYDKNQPIYALNAVIDTAPIGNISSWETDPFSPTEKNGWLYGRGSADSKAGAAIFLALTEEIEKSKKNFIVYFDADEHTGEFNGSKALIETYPNLAGVFLGYPGNDKFIIGSRGFYRSFVTIKGTAEHSGSKNTTVDNAIIKACKFIDSLELDIAPTLYPIAPKITITAINGGQGFAMVPDKITLNIDIRTTLDFTDTQAKEFLQLQASTFDDDITIEKYRSFPPFILKEDSRIRKAMEIAINSTGLNIPSAVSGASNTGNLFAMHGIDTIAGFGVTYKNAHAANECVDLNSIDTVYNVYKNLIQNI